MNDNAVASVALTAHDKEALMWSLAHIGDRPRRIPKEPEDPLAVLLAAGWTRAEILKACKAMFPIVVADTLTTPLVPIQRDILRVSVENSSWLAPYEQYGPSSLLDTDGARAVLRGLAAKLETLGIEVNFIPES